MRTLRNAFTMVELIFVIVVMAIVGTIGVEIFRNTYDAYLSSSVNQRLQSETELALKQIANRLQYRIRDSLIARETSGTAGYFNGLSGYYPPGNPDRNATVIEWVGYDIDGWLGDGTSTLPTWSGFIDVNDLINPSTLSSPGSDLRSTGRANAVIASLGNSDVNDSALFFTGANTNVLKDYGWKTADYNISNTAAHPIGFAAALEQIATNGYTFSGMDVYEQYKLAWTAYALELRDSDGDGRSDDLLLYYDYQPWHGETYDVNGTSALLIDNVTTFKFQAIGDIIKVQLCIDNNATGNIPAHQHYSLCKEKVIF